MDSFQDETGSWLNMFFNDSDWKCEHLWWIPCSPGSLRSAFCAFSSYGWDKDLQCLVCNWKYAHWFPFSICQRCWWCDVLNVYLRSICNAFWVFSVVYLLFSRSVLPNIHTCPDMICLAFRHLRQSSCHLPGRSAQSDSLELAMWMQTGGREWREWPEPRSSRTKLTAARISAMQTVTMTQCDTWRCSTVFHSGLVGKNTVVITYIYICMYNNS